METFTLFLWGGKILGRLTEILYNVLNSNSISTRASIGKNTVFYHHGLGCVIHRNCVIGDNCKVFGNVTIGCKWFKRRINDGKVPRIGNNVMIGAGTLILGDIYIGDNSFIGANSTVLSDVPQNSIVTGNPARIKLRYES